MTEVCTSCLFVCSIRWSGKVDTEFSSCRRYTEDKVIIFVYDVALQLVGGPINSPVICPSQLTSLGSITNLVSSRPHLILPFCC